MIRPRKIKLRLTVPQYEALQSAISDRARWLEEMSNTTNLAGETRALINAEHELSKAWRLGETS